MPLSTKRRLLILGGLALSGCALLATAWLWVKPPALGWLPSLFSLLACLLALGLGAFAFTLLGKLNAAIARAKYYGSSTTLGNSAKLSHDFAQLPQKAGNVFVLIRLNDFKQLLSLFGVDVAQQTADSLAPALDRFAKQHAGNAYWLAADQLALLCNASNPDRFLSDLRDLISEMEHVNVKDQFVVYSFHYTFAYAVYFLSDNENPLEDIAPLMALSHSALSRLGAASHTEETVFTEKNRPDWELQNVLRSQVAQAWRNREFVPYYHVAYDLKTGRPSGAELLVRWQHPEKGLLLPGDFLPAMESEGLIMNLDLYMMEEACKKIKGWMDAELVTVPLSINISKLNIHRPDFCKQLKALCEKYDVPPNLIELELNEEVLLFERNEEFMDIVRDLDTFGFCLSIDNFANTQNASVVILRDLPVGVVKVANRFFTNTRQPGRDRTFVECIINMTQRMNIRVIAMGVETQEDALLCRELACNRAQGYFFSQPMSNEDFEKFIF